MDNLVVGEQFSVAVYAALLTNWSLKPDN